MITNKKSATMKFLEEVAGAPLGFGDMIHSIRLCDEISQSKLAEMMGISRSYLCDIESGRRFVSVEKAAQFAHVLGYSEPQFISLVLEDQLKHAGMDFVVELKKAA